MLKIQTDETKVTVTVQGQYPIDSWSYPFTFNAGSKDYAALPRHNLTEHMETKLRAIREKAYTDGWKEAKAKRAKRSWFSGMW